MPLPTQQQLSYPKFVEQMMKCFEDIPLHYEPLFSDLMKRPKFRKTREVHAARARKLRRRGEYVHFLRWEHGHCIYGWSGPRPETLVFHRMPRKSIDPEYVQISYETRWIWGETR